MRNNAGWHHNYLVVVKPKSNINLITNKTLKIMRVGSLVELVDDNWTEIFPGEIYPIKNKIYTIRAIDKGVGGDICILLNEIINKIEPLIGFNGSYQGEIMFRIHRLREVQPHIANIEEHIKENTLEPQLT